MDLFLSYLSNRNQCCKIINTFGDWSKTVAVKTRQSILVPLLFNLFSFFRDINTTNVKD